MDWQSIGLTFRLAVCTVIILLIIGIPTSYWLANSKSKVRYLIEALVALPLVLPPTVLGFYLLCAMGPHSVVGQQYSKLFGGSLVFSFEGLIVGSVVYSFPFAVQPFLNGFLSVNPRCVEAAWGLGATRFQTFFRVILPLCKTSILTGVILSFAHTLGEFGVVLMIGGNLSGITRTVSVSIYDDVQALDYARAGTTSAFLVCVSVIALAWTGWLRRKQSPNSRLV